MPPREQEGPHVLNAVWPETVTLPAVDGSEPPHESDAIRPETVTRCPVDECGGKVKAKGLCSVHYMRARRTGDPRTARQPGRPVDQSRALARQMLPEWSDRTFARYWLAIQSLHNHVPAEEVQETLAMATRPNGKLNVAKLERLTWATVLAERMLARRRSHDQTGVE